MYALTVLEPPTWVFYRQHSLEINRCAGSTTMIFQVVGNCESVANVTNETFVLEMLLFKAAVFTNRFQLRITTLTVRITTLILAVSNVM